MSVRVEEVGRQRPSCPYCKGEIADGSATWECPSCATVHHADCARANGRCTVLGCTGVAPRGVRGRRVPRADAIAAVVFAAMIVGVGVWVFEKFLPSPPPAAPPWEQQMKESRERHEQVLHDLVEACATVIDLDARDLPAGAAFNRALALYDEAYRSRGEAPTELARRLRQITSEAAHSRVDALMAELQRGLKRPVPQVHPDESAELERRRRRAETEKAIRDAEGALPK